MIKAKSLTVDQTDYTEIADFGAAGQISVVCVTETGSAVYLSLDGGKTDSVILYPGTRAAAFNTRRAVYQKVFAKTAGTAVNVVVSCEDGGL